MALHIRRIGGLILLALIVAAIVLVDWQFWARYLSKPSSPDGLSVEWYQPQVPVGGQYVPLQRASATPKPDFATSIAIAEDSDTAALLVALGDQLVLEHYWGETKRETLQLTFSFHKTVSALLVGAAIEDGVIQHVDLPVGEMIADWQDDPRGEPTLRSAMQMASGYVQPGFEGGAFSSAAAFYYGSDLAGATLNGDIIASPQPTFDYSDRTAQIVGLALQNTLPMDYENYLSQRLWQPLGAAGGSVLKARNDGPVVTYCCLFATAEDWVKVGMLIRDSGEFAGRQIIPSDWVETMLEPSASNPNFGLFLWRGTPFNAERSYTPASPARVTSASPFAVDDVVFLDGAGGQRIYVSRTLNLVVVRLGAYRSDWDDTALFNAIVSEIEASSPALIRS